MKRKLLLQTTPCREPEDLAPDQVTAVSQVVEVKGKMILNIDLFTGAGLQARYFADREKREYGTWVRGEWSGAIIQNIACKCMGKPTETYWYGMGHVCWKEKEDERRAEDYLGKRLTWWQEQIGSEKYRKKIERKEERIQQLMDQIPCVPDGVEQWLAETVFPEEYLFFRKGKKTYTYSCTACGAEGRKKNGWKHNQMTVCPKCRQPVQAKSRTQKIQEKEFIYLLQRFGEQGVYKMPGSWIPIVGQTQWVERGFRAYCVWEGGKKEISLHEEIRAVIDNGKTWGKVYYGQQYHADEFEQDWWDTNRLNKRFDTGHLYPGNLSEVLPAAGLDRTGLREMAEKERLKVNAFIVKAEKRKYMEYLIKSGMTKLAAEITGYYGIYSDPEEFSNGARGAGSLRINGDRRSRLKRMNGGLTAWRWLEYEQKTGKKISQDTLEWLEKKGLTYSECDALLKELGSVNRMVNYMKKQTIAPSRIIEVWRDYLRMARDEGMDTSDDIIRFPRDLKRRHDELVERITQRRDAERKKAEEKKCRELNRRIAEHLSQAEKYRYQTDGYQIIPAQKCEELNEEGRILHHCVGASGIYKENMAEGTAWILFLRREKAPEQPYYTLEIDMRTDQIKQAYSEYDRKPDWEQVNRILTKFKNYLKTVRQRSA